jgi:hypothetical protein
VNRGSVTDNRDTNPVIVGVDGSFAAIRAARWAAVVAEKFAAPLQIMHAAADPAQRESADAILQSAHQAVRVNFKGLHITTARVEGSAEHALIESSHTARLIVLGSDDLSSGTAVFGESICPVVAWRGGAASPTRQPVVVGVDHDQDSRVAIPASFELADRLGVGLIAVHAWTFQRPVGDVTLPAATLWHQVETDAQQHLSETLLGWINLYPNVEVTQVVVPDHPSRALLRSSQDAQMLVVGSVPVGLLPAPCQVPLDLTCSVTRPSRSCFATP